MSKWLVCLGCVLVVLGSVSLVLFFRPSREMDSDAGPNGASSSVKGVEGISTSREYPNTLARRNGTTPWEIDRPAAHGPRIRTESREKNESPEQSFRIVSVAVRVVCNNRALQGARCRVIEVKVLEHGYRDAFSAFRGLYWSNIPLSDSEGKIETKARVGESLPPDTIFQVLAFHPQRGTGCTEKRLWEIDDGGEVAVEIKRGKAIRGRIVTPEGEPFEGATVEMSGTTPANAVCLSGLGSLTDENGSFFIPGIRFGNIPHAVHAHFSESGLDKDARALRFLVGNCQRVLSDADYDQEARLWDVGDLVLDVKEIHCIEIPQVK